MEIEDFSNEDKEMVISLLKPDKDEYEKKFRIWDWQYSENPCAGDFHAGTTVKIDGAIIGFVGYMPVELRYNNTDMKGVCGCDLIVSPSHRGKGYGRDLINASKNTAPIVRAGLGSLDNSERAISDELPWFIRRPLQEACSSRPHRVSCCQGPDGVGAHYRT